MRIGPLYINGFASMAPMAGVADRAQREIARSFGAGITTGEMVSAKGIVVGGKNSTVLLQCDNAHPFGVQLFGSSPDIMAEAARRAEENGPDFIDLNFGCPAPKITSGMAGSALLNDLPLAQSIVEAVVRAVRLPVTVKMRKGFDSGSDVSLEAALRFEAAGAAALCVHGKTRAQMYAPGVDLDCIAKVKGAVGIPVIGNGDIFSELDAKLMFERTNCDLVMVGRGALGNPWLFSRINALISGDAVPELPDIKERIEVMRTEIALLLKYKGEDIGMREARKHASWYVRGLRNAAKLREMCFSLTSPDDIGRLCAAMADCALPV
jgi:tRNA-dihydrouridine synthase B